MLGDADTVVELKILLQDPFHLVELPVMADAVVF